VTSAVIVTLRVRTNPARAFEAFTQEIDRWWRPSDLFQLTPRGDGVLRFEPGENGRLVTTLSNGSEFEVGRITDWSPGARVAFTWRQATFTADQITYVAVSFEPIGDETRVTVEHRGWDAIPQEHAARHGFPLGPFQMRLAEHWRALLAALSDRASA
jgi:uncharacterized protein YndB with AHSA1/START domain